MYGFSVEGASSLEPGATIYGPEDSTGKVAMSVINGTVTELLAVIAIDQAQGQWFVDQEQTLRLTPTSLPYD
jgi:hypothetical protein